MIALPTSRPIISVNTKYLTEGKFNVGYPSSAYNKFTYSQSFLLNSSGYHQS